MKHLAWLVSQSCHRSNAYTIMARRLALICCVLCAAALSCRPHAVTPVPRFHSNPQPVQLFEDIADSSGLRFRHFAAATRQKYLPEIMGSGVALLDYNGDGALDVFVVQGGPVDPANSKRDLISERTTDQRPGCRLYRNDLPKTGKLHFTDVTAEAGLANLKVECGMGVAVGDFDNDGYPDIYVTGYGHSVLLHNNRHGGFVDVTDKAGVGDDGNWATSASFVDYDQDGRLDLVVANYVDFTPGRNKRCKSVGGEPDYCGPSSYHGVKPRLYRNLGGGRFQDVSAQSGIGSIAEPGLGVACVDFEGDGWPDVLLANDQAPNTLWLNKHDGTFRETARAAGCAYAADGRNQANMGIAIGDVYNQGTEDVLITHLINEGVTLFENDGHANFTDATAVTGLREATYPFTGFGTEFFDYDNDGWLDLFVTNGAVALPGSNHPDRLWPFEQTNQLFHNEGQTRRFTDVTNKSGEALRLRGAGRGAAFGDLDNDGRIDVVVSNNNGLVRVLHNTTETRNHWLLVRLIGKECNSMGLGARVGVVRKGQATIWRRCHTDGSYCSASDSRLHFGLGLNPTIEALIVKWPHGKTEKWHDKYADSIVVLKQGEGSAD